MTGSSHRYFFRKGTFDCNQPFFQWNLVAPKFSPSEVVLTLSKVITKACARKHSCLGLVVGSLASKFRHHGLASVSK